ncbi:MAG TPA: VWA domain-containing protein [Thermomicrobiales bacterium]|nr:VWA domain-containing protein [Thermomicrobiales bacterium]
MSTPTIRIRHQSRFRPVEAGTFHVLLRVSAPQVVTTDRQRPPLDVSFVVDRSGSMSGGAFELARQGVEHALRLLDEHDTASVVVYDDRIDTLLSQRALDRTAHDKAVRRLLRVGPRGSTDLAGGWLTGCDQLAPIADGRQVVRAEEMRSVVRTLLLTDGLANVGMTDPDEIATHAGELAARGISTSTFGVGTRYDEDLLARMADAGRGHFHHIADATMIPTVFAGELGEMLELAMRDATLAIRLPDGWQASLMNDLPFERADGWLRMPLGELASRESRSLLWELTLPESVDGRRDEIDVRLEWRDARTDEAQVESFVHTIETHQIPGVLDREVQDELAGFIGARARAEAVRFNKLGRYDLASDVVRQAAMAMPRTEAGQAAARELMEDVAPSVNYAANPADLKRHYNRSRMVQRSRKDYTEKQ